MSEAIRGRNIGGPDGATRGSAKEGTSRAGYGALCELVDVW